MKQIKKGVRLYWNGCVLGMLVVILKNIRLEETTGDFDRGFAGIVYMLVFGFAVIVAAWLVGNIRDYYRPE